jgi:DHA3 family macrolide efflux protein-like MFS transporter
MEVSTVENNSGIKSLFKYRDYTLLLLANFISRFGDSVDSIAYGWMVYKLTGSKLLLGSIFALNAIPNIIIGPFAGVLADRLNKKKLIGIGYTGRGMVVSVTAVLYYFNILEPWHLFLFTIFNSTLETVTAPSVSSLLPFLIPKEEFLKANSFSSSAYRFAELIGTAMAGAIIALIGISGAIFIDGATFFIAAVIIILLKVQITVEKKETMNVKSYLEDLKVGFKYIKQNKIVRISIFLFAIANFCVAPINIMMPVFANDILKGGPELLSAMGIALTIGTILGGLLVGQYGGKFKMSKLLIGGMIFFGISYSILYFPGNIISVQAVSVIITIISFFFIGFFIPVMVSPITSYMMVNTDKKILGRVSSVMVMISCAAIPLGAAITGVITEILSISMIFLLMGVIISLVAASLIFNKEFKAP